MQCKCFHIVLKFFFSLLMLSKIFAVKIVLVETALFNVRIKKGRKEGSTTGRQEAGSILPQ